jgi:DnaJ-class molecular chaperone
MNRKYQEITEARKLLGLTETATMAAIKSNYRRLVAKWHPDKLLEDQETCAEMTRRIISAYQTIMDYCHQYQYSFSEETIKEHLSPEQWWFEHFGDDPLWGKAKNPK